MRYQALDFFDRYMINGNKLAVELEKFVEILKRRILREEAVLFAEYEKL